MKIPYISVEQMTEIDRIMTEDLSINIFQMMENAGRILSKLAINKFNPKHVTILIGPGNNGGGGLVSARYLHNRNIKVSLVISTTLKEAPQQHLKTAKELGMLVVNKIPKETDLIIDALLGYNSKGAPRGRILELVQEANELNKPVLSLDVPTGFNLETGDFFENSFKNSTVLALGLPKQNMETIHDLYIGDIGVPKEAYAKIGIIVENLFTEGDYNKLH